MAIFCTSFCNNIKYTFVIVLPGFQLNVNTRQQKKGLFLVIVAPMRSLGCGGVGIKLVGVPQPKQKHGFLVKFQGMLTPRGSRAD